MSEFAIKWTNLWKIIDKLEDLKLKYIDSVKNDKELEPHLEIFTEFEEAERLEVKLRDHLFFSNNKVNSSQVQLHTNANVSVKNPEILLPKFTGNY